MIDTVAANTVCDRFTALLATPSAIVRLSQAMGYVWARNDCEGAQFIDPVTFAVAYVDAPVHSTLRDSYTLAIANSAGADDSADSAGADMWTDAAVCTDCLMWLVNGDDTGFCSCADDTHSDDAHCHAIHNSDVSILVPSDDDGYFSMNACDACGTDLGGMRHDAQIMD